MSDQSRKIGWIRHWPAAFAMIVVGSMAVYLLPEHRQSRSFLSSAFGADESKRPPASKKPVAAPKPDPLGDDEDISDAPPGNPAAEDSEASFIAKREEILLSMEIEKEILLRDLGQNHPKIRALNDAIRITANWLEQRKKDRNRIVVPTRIRTFATDDEDARLDREARQLANQVRNAKPEEKIALRKQLEELTEKQFEHRQKRRKEEFETLTQRVEQLKKTHARRQANKMEVIQRRVAELLDPNADLNWNGSDAPDDLKVGQLDVGQQSKVSRIESKSHATLAGGSGKLKTRQGPEPTYNGVTLSEWLRLMETERNASKISDAVAGMNHLIDEAEPVVLIRATLRMLRSHGCETANNPPGEKIMNGSCLLLTRLPCEMVVEELINDLAESANRKPTQVFLSYFLGLISEQPNANNRRNNPNERGPLLSYAFINHVSSVDSSRQEASIQRIRNEIHRRSRRLIGTLVAAAEQDEHLCIWVMHSAKMIKGDQPIATYPTLVPVVERVFDRPDEGPWKEWPSQKHSAAELLAESGLRIYDICAFAEKRINLIEPRLAEIIERVGFNRPEPFTEVDLVIKCLNVIAPQSPSVIDALSSFSDRLSQAVLENISKEEAAGELKPVYAPTSENGNGDWLLRYRFLADKLAMIGPPAKESLPLLRKLLAIPKQRISISNPDHWQKELHDHVNLAIKAIEEPRKPKPTPDPLPDDEKPLGGKPAKKKPGLQLRVHFADRHPVVEAPFTTIISVRNASDEIATDVVVTCKIPDHTELKGASPPPAFDGKQMVWKITSIPPNTVGELKVTLVPKKPGQFAFEGCVTCSNLSDAANNQYVKVRSTSVSHDQKPIHESQVNAEDEPTYKGMTLAEAMKIVKTDRNRESVSVAVLAMNHLMDQGDPRELARATLQMMRFQGVLSADHVGDIIMKGARLLLIQLPSDIVVEEMIAELPSALIRNPTRYFYVNFLLSLSWGQVGSDIYSPDLKMKLLVVDQSRMSASVQKLTQEIRRCAPQLISTLLNLVSQDEQLIPFSCISAANIIRITKQPIAAYPDAIPFFERALAFPWSPQSGTGFDHRPDAARLLGESGLRVSEVIEFAREQMKDDTRFTTGVNCLVCVAPHSPEAIRHLTEGLRGEWVSLSKQAELVVEGLEWGSAPRSALEQKLISHCVELIKAIAKIGGPATEAIPLLKKIANSEKSLIATPNQLNGSLGNFGFGGSFSGPKLQEVTIEAIKQIEEATPKSPQEKLPDDIRN